MGYIINKGSGQKLEVDNNQLSLLLKHKLLKEENGLWLINPGSTSWPRGGSKRSYAVMTIDGTNVDVRIKTLE